LNYFLSEIFPARILIQTSVMPVLTTLSRSLCHIAD